MPTRKLPKKQHFNVWLFQVADVQSCSSSSSSNSSGSGSSCSNSIVLIVVVVVVVTTVKTKYNLSLTVLDKKNLMMAFQKRRE